MQAAVIWDKPEGALTAGDILCPAETGKTQTCGTCAVCWAPAASSKRIVFMGHGMTRRGSAPRRKALPTMEITPPASAESDPIRTGHAAFLARLCDEELRLERAIATVRALIPIYEKLTEEWPVAPVVEPAPIVADGRRKPNLSEEQLAKLRANAEKAREAATAKRNAASARADGMLAEILRPVPVAAVVQPIVTPVAVAPQPKLSRMEALMRVSTAVQRAAPGEPIAADITAVRAWAGQRGLPFLSWDDLPRVNDRRERLGLPAFKRDYPQRGRFG
jgi:hypothetical protein